jgi:hypothetical protein
MDKTLTSVVERERPSQRVPGPPPAQAAVPTAELAECNCPDFCERDHANE